MKPVNIIMAFMLSLTCSACSPSDNEDEIPGQPGNSDNGSAPEPEEPGGNNDRIQKIQITIGSQTFKAILEENAAATAFKEMLPLHLDMADVNSNEKYFQLGNNLPTLPSNPGTIRTGDLMLWGSNGLVLFYKTFSTSYSYTPLGSMEDADGLEGVLGTGNVTVKFQLLEEIERR